MLHEPPTRAPSEPPAAERAVSAERRFLEESVHSTVAQSVGRWKLAHAVVCNIKQRMLAQWHYTLLLSRVVPHDVSGGNALDTIAWVDHVLLPGVMARLNHRLGAELTFFVGVLGDRASSVGHGVRHDDVAVVVMERTPVAGA